MEEPVVVAAAPTQEVKAEEPVVVAAAPTQEVKVEELVVVAAAPTEEVKVEEPIVVAAVPAPSCARPMPASRPLLAMKVPPAHESVAGRS